MVGVLSWIASTLKLLRADEAQPERWSFVMVSEKMRRIGRDMKRDAAELLSRTASKAPITHFAGTITYPGFRA